MNKDSSVFVLHIRDSINNILGFVENISEADFFKNRMIQSAVIRELEIIGEAVKNLPIEFRQKYNQVLWKDIAGMRDKIAHYYFGVDLDKIWKVIKEEITPLKKQVKDILSKEKVKM